MRCLHEEVQEMEQENVFLFIGYMFAEGTVKEQGKGFSFVSSARKRQLRKVNTHDKEFSVYVYICDYKCSEVLIAHAYIKGSSLK